MQYSTRLLIRDDARGVRDDLARAVPDLRMRRDELKSLHQPTVPRIWSDLSCSPARVRGDKITASEQECLR
jgi:hypothetical protein